MAQPWTVLLNNGSLQSLVATAMYAEKPRLLAVYIHDGRSNDVRAHECFNQQVEHYEVAKHLELTLGHLGASTDPTSAEPGIGPRVPLADTQEIMAAAGLGMQLKSERLVWCGQVGEHFDAVARWTETMMLIQQIIHIQRGVELIVDMPLLEMTDRQLIELGHQMNVPWAKARSCEARTNDPCGQCAGCKRRAVAFTEAGVEDPLHAVLRS